MRLPRIAVVDGGQALLDQVTSVTRALRPRPEVTSYPTLDALEAAGDEHGGIDVLVAGPAVGELDRMRDLRRLRLQLPQASVVLAFDRWRTSSLRETVRTGAVDILRLPVPDEVLLEALEEALEVRWASPALPIREERRSGDARGSVIAVVSATGGCGKTFFATNVAYHLQSKFKKRTCLIDLDLQFGELSTALRLKPKATIADLLAADGTADDLPRRLQDAVAVHETGIHVLAAPDEPADADGIEAAEVNKVIDAARARFDYVVIDTPAALSEAVLVSLEQADQIFAIATLDLPSVRNLGVLLSTFKQLKVPGERVQLVLNKVERDVGIDVEAITRYFPQGFSIVVPYGKEVNRSLNMGMPMLAYAPRGEVAKVLEGGLSRVLEADEPAEEAGSRRQRRLLRRKHTA
ncbi:MAG: CpaE family protein [Acidimicrobiia bacterium]